MIGTRRTFISSTTKTIAIASLAAMAQAQQSNRVQLSQIHAADEKPEITPTLEEPDSRIGYAIVGLDVSLSIKYFPHLAAPKDQSLSPS